MSGGDINTLFRGTMLDTHHDKLPFQNHKELYNIIDSTPLGDAQWQSFTIKYDRDGLDGKRPVWMDIEHEVRFHNPNQLLEMMLACPDFADEFDYSPFKEYGADNKHHFQNLMSGNLAWTQAVCIIYMLKFYALWWAVKDIISQDPDTHGSIFIPIILRSDKTTISVGTGHNQYWPLYMSIRNIHDMHIAMVSYLLVF